MRSFACNISIILILSMFFYGCTDAPKGDNCSLGIFVNRFPLSPQQDFSDGIEQLEDLGVRTVGIYLGPFYRDLNPQLKEEVYSLKELVSLPEYRALFEADFDTFVFDCYSFSSGFDLGVKLKKVNYLPGKAYEEIKELAEYLHSEYGGQGKRFIIKNSLVDQLYDYNDDKEFDKYREMLSSWFKERIKAVKDATKGRRRSVYSAVEFDLVVPSSTFKCVLTEIVPHLEPDLFSFNARRLNGQWEKFPLYLKWIELHLPQSQQYGVQNLMISEATIISDTPELETQKLKWFIRQARQSGIPYILYFPAFGSEEDACPVFFPDGYTSLIWNVFREQLQRASVLPGEDER